MKFRSLIFGVLSILTTSNVVYAASCDDDPFLICVKSGDIYYFELSHPDRIQLTLEYEWNGDDDDNPALEDLYYDVRTGFVTPAEATIIFACIMDESKC